MQKYKVNLEEMTLQQKKHQPKEVHEFPEHRLLEYGKQLEMIKQLHRNKKEEAEQNEFDFQPKINKRSQAITEERRNIALQSMMAPEDPPATLDTAVRIEMSSRIKQHQGENFNPSAAIQSPQLLKVPPTV